MKHAAIAAHPIKPAAADQLPRRGPATAAPPPPPPAPIGAALLNNVNNLLKNILIN